MRRSEVVWLVGLLGCTRSLVVGDPVPPADDGAMSDAGAMRDAGAPDARPLDIGFGPVACGEWGPTITLGEDSAVAWGIETLTNGYRVYDVDAAGRLQSHRIDRDTRRRPEPVLSEGVTLAGTSGRLAIAGDRIGLVTGDEVVVLGLEEGRLGAPIASWRPPIEFAFAGIARRDTRTLAMVLERRGVQSVAIDDDGAVTARRATNAAFVELSLPAVVSGFEDGIVVFRTRCDDGRETVRSAGVPFVETADDGTGTVRPDCRFDRIGLSTFGQPATVMRVAERGRPTVFDATRAFVGHTADALLAGSLDFLRDEVVPLPSEPPALAGRDGELLVVVAPVAAPEAPVLLTVEAFTRGERVSAVELGLFTGGGCPVGRASYDVRTSAAGDLLMWQTTCGGLATRFRPRC